MGKKGVSEKRPRERFLCYSEGLAVEEKKKRET